MDLNVHTLYFGTPSNVISRSMSGFIDEIGLFNYDAQNDVAAIYNNGLTHDMSSLPTPPVVYWRNT